MAVVDAERCTGCGACRLACPVDAIVVEEVARVEAHGCLGCGDCLAVCPADALSLADLLDGAQRPAPS